MKIANKISISFLAVALILTSVAGTIFYIIAKNNLQKSIYNNLTTVVALRSKHIETYLEMLKISVGQLSKSPTLENYLKINGKGGLQQAEAFEQAMKRLKRTKEANPAIAEFLLMDKTGKVVVSSNESSIGKDKATDSIFVGAQKEVYIKDAYYSEVFKEPLIAASAPILDSQTGEFLGVIAARVKLKELNNIVVEKTGMGESGEIYIVNKDGFMITPSRFIKDPVLKQKVDTENTRKARLHKGIEHVLEGKKIIGVFPDYRSVMVLGTHEYIPQMQWAVLAEIDVRDVLAPLAKLRLIFVAVLFITPIVAWLLGMFISELIVDPLHILYKGVEIIGSGNLDYKIGTQAKDEIGQFSRAFDEMVTNLKKITASREALKKEIAEREKAEDLLKKTEAFTKSTLNSITDIFYSFDLNGKFLSWNEAFKRISGYSDQELSSKKPIDFFSGEGIQRIAEAVEKIYKEGASKAEANFVLKDGRQIPYEFTGSILKDSEGNAIGFSGTGRDLTEHKNAEEKSSQALKEEVRFRRILTSMLDDNNKVREELEKNIKELKDSRGLLIQEKEKAQNYFDTAAVIMLVRDIDGRVSQINEAGCEILGYEKEGVEGKIWFDSFTPERIRQEDREKFRRIIHGEEGLLGYYESPIINKKGEERLIAWHSVVLKDGAGKVFSVLSSGEDITARKKIEASQRLAQLGELVSNMAHEVNNPLMIISGNAQLCLMEDLKNKVVMENLGIILDQCNRAKAIIERLLAFSKPSKGELKNVDINAIVDSSVKLLEHQYSLVNIKMIRNFQPQLPGISIDDKQIQQVLINIIKNAAEAMPAGGMITIVTSQEGQCLRVDITDTGKGMSDEAKEKLFIPFFTTKEKGTGLGLAVCYGIIKAYGGEIKYTSKAGEGTTATILLPVGGG